MKDTEIISMQLLIECLGKTQNAGYLYLCANHHNLANYVERSRFNRLVTSLFTVIKEIRKKYHIRRQMQADTGHCPFPAFLEVCLRTKKAASIKLQK